MAKLLSNTRVYGTATVDTQLLIRGFLNANSTSTGALQVSGGIGVSGGGFFGGTVTATNFVGSISGSASNANNINGGTAGQLVYQSAPSTTGFVGPGNSGELLISQGTSSPIYVNTTTFAVGLAKNLLGGAANQFAYQTAANTTNFATTGSMYVGRAVLADALSTGAASTATNLAGGTAGQVPYQTAPGLTSFFGPGTSGQILVSAGAAAPVYTNTSSIYVKDSDFANDIRGGVSGQFLYQVSANNTDFISTASMYVGRAVLADTASSTGAADTVKTVARTDNINHYLVFVDSNNATATAENLYTTSTVAVNASTGNMGLGTASPSEKLELLGPANTARIKITNSSLNRSSLLAHDSSGFYWKPTNNGDVFQLREASDTAIFTLNPNTQLIGIGTTGPSTKLHVDGSSDTRIRVSATDGAFYRGFEVFAGSGLKGGMYYRSTEGNVLQLWGPNNSVGAMYIDANNNVGIANIVPDAALTVGVNVGSNNTDYGIKVARHGTAAVPGTWSTTIPAINIVDWSGDGPTSVETSALLMINCGRMATTDTYAKNASIIAVGYDSGADSPLRLDGAGNLWIGWNRSTLLTNNGTMSLLVRNGVNIGTNYQTVTAPSNGLAVEGNIGAGTSSPAAKIHAAGTSNHIAITSSWSNGTNDIIFSGSSTPNGGASSTAARIRVVSSSSAGAALGDMLFTVNAGDSFRDAMYISTTGNVGIGTTSPSVLYTPGLHIYGSNPSLKLEGSSTSAWEFLHLKQPSYERLVGMRTNGNFVINNGTNLDANNEFVVAWGGNVGIGASPLFTSGSGLEITRSGTATLRLDSGSFATEIYGYADGTGIYQLSAGYLTFGTNNTERVRITSTGVVAVGTTTPNGGVGRLEMGVDGVGNGIGFYAGSGTSFRIWRDSDLGLIGRGSTAAISINTSDNVGIGNTSPGFKLDITGTGRATSDFRAPIFYDTDNTNFYLDPASTSVLNVVSANRVNVGNYQYFGINGLGANATQARRYEIARIGIDFNDWNSVGLFEVEISEKYYETGLRKRYVVYYGYVSNSGVHLVEYNGRGSNHFRVQISGETTVSGDQRYISVYVDVRYYSQVDVQIKTTRTVTTSNPPGIGQTWINTAPSGSNISDFTADSVVYLTSAATSIAATRYFDSDNTTYYIEPAGTSEVNTISFLAGGTSQYYTAAGGLRGYIQATDSTGAGAAGLIMATSGGEEIVFKDGGLGGDINMVIKGTGNVGIGTTSPGNFNGLSFGDAILDVNGSIQVRGDATNGIAIMQFGGDTYRKANIYSSVGTDTPYLAFGVSSSGSSSSATERVRITNDGNGTLSVGTSSPGLVAANRGTICINGTTDAVMTMQVNGGTSMYLYTGGSYSEIVSASNKPLYFSVGSERMRINTFGYVGVGGGFDPTASLHVRGSSSGTLVNIEDTTSGSTITGAQLNITRNGTIANQGQGAAIRFQDSTINNIRVIESGGGALMFIAYRNNWKEDMRLTNNGALLVGTTSDPTGGTTQHFFSHSGSNATAFIIGDAANTSSITGLYLRSTDPRLVRPTNVPIHIADTSGTKHVTILGSNSEGRVGIGVESPSYKLHVTTAAMTAAAISTGWPAYNAETAAQSKTLLYLDGGGNGSVSTAGQGPSAVLLLGNYYDSRAIITPTGAGGASPSDQGTGRGKDLMVKAGNSDNGNGYVGGRLFLAGGSGYNGGAYNTLYGSVILQPQGGDVGIGTSSPQGRLHVSGGNAVLYSGSSGNSPKLIFGGEYSSTDKSIYLENFFMVYKGHNNEGHRFITVNASGTEFERFRISGDGTVRPGADNSQNLGSTSFRWANVYTGDLHLSNKGKSNEVDGTWGDWTVQEGEEDLFVINRRNGKKFRIKLEEV